MGQKKENGKEQEGKGERREKGGGQPS